MNADLELYKVFCEVVKHKNISKTAENMYISQSAITQSIQKLENILGGKVPYKQNQLVKAWVLIHKEELESLWKLLQDENDYFKIEPLK